MEFVSLVVFLVVIGILIDMARGRHPQFRLYRGQKLRQWDEPTKPEMGTPDKNGKGTWI
jgi:hypothetical protein